MGEGVSVRQQERETLRYIIQQWNSNRLDLFEISEPDENLEFTGVMRFYFQDSGQKVATKCIRVTSSDTTRTVIETLVEKFRPDMRMLSVPEYTLYEIHENGEERRLSEEEKPLLVQLNWNKDDREGRFLLRRMDMNGVAKSRTLPTVMTALPQKPPPPSGVKGEATSFIRKLSRREKKDQKKQEKLLRATNNNNNNEQNNVAEKLYTELPETSFTRSISNPEVVMQRRRALKLEKKLLEFRSKNGGPDTGGTLKIYGVSLCPDVPYKTLLLSVHDTALSVVAEMLDKYGLCKEDPNAYCLVQCIVTEEEALDGYQGKIVPQKEYILDDDECPLAILMNHPKSRGAIMFQVRRRPLDHGQRRRKKKPVKGAGHPPVGPHHSNGPQRHQHALEDLLPYLVEIGPDGVEVNQGATHPLHLNVTEVGCERAEHSGAQSLQLFGPLIHPSHCVITHLDGIVTVTPSAPEAETDVNFKRIYETTILQHGAVVRFGRTHTFRFMDPQQDERLRLHPSSMQPPPVHPHHQAHDRLALDHSMQGPGVGQLMGSHFGGSRANSIGGSQTNIARPPVRSGSEMALARSAQEQWGAPRDPILPAVLEFPEEAEDAFLQSIVSRLDPTDVQFKLAPTYTLYMAARFRASTHYRPDLSPTERAQKLTVMLKKVASVIHEVIEFKQRDATSLAFWMANASELLHFLKMDRHICGYSLDAQDILAEAVQFAFRKLVEYMQSELSSAMPMFLEDRDDRGEEEGSSLNVLSLLTNTMSLLRMCRVNAALTIQLFSQLFHYINMWAFNRIVTETSPNYCSRLWGERIKERVCRIEQWAEKRGLELATDCHLAKLSQASLLLISPKSCLEDVAALSSTCFKLNSIQLREILTKYQLTPPEPPVPRDLIDNVVSVAETTADGLAREDGREVRLEEEADLQLPFLLPEDGYSCDVVRAVPSGLAEFLDPLQRAQLCRMTPQHTSAGLWTIYMHGYPQQEFHAHRPPPGPRSPSAMSNRSVSVPRGEPEIHTIELRKFKSGMGLSIVATKGENQDKLGIYIKSVVPGGAADQDGRLKAGDQLLSVDGRSLVGVSQEEAAQLMVGTGSVVALEVARQGALYHGLAPLLSQPSPQVNRVSQDPRRDSSSAMNMPGPPHGHPHHQPHPANHQNYPTAPRPHPQASAHHPLGARIQPSKSVPALNSEPVGGMHNMGRRFEHQEGAAPGYSRASSSTSLGAQHPARSRSTQNVNESGGANMSGRHPSTPALNSEDDKHYQNVSFHQGAQDPRMGSQRGARPPIFPPGFPGPGQGPQHNAADSHRPMSALMHREEVHRQEYLMGRPPSQQTVRSVDPRLTLPLGEEHRRRFNGYPGAPVSAHSPGHHPMVSPVGGHAPQPLGSPGGFGPRPPPQFVRGNPRYSSTHGGVFPPHMSPHSPQPSQLSPQSFYPPSAMHAAPHQTLSPQQLYMNQQQHAAAAAAKQPPPTAPKPNRDSGHFGTEAPEKPLRQGEPHASHGGRSVPSVASLHHPRSSALDESVRESPPPPPPPTSTHPLMQQSKNGVMVPTNGKQNLTKSQWEREEKERYETRKRAAVRQWRDEQIKDLDSKQGMRTAQEEELLKALVLEREFQRRAEAETEDVDEEEEEDAEGEEVEGEKDLADARKPPARDAPAPVPSSANSINFRETPLRDVAHRTLSNQDDVSSRGVKAEEIKRKQKELELAQQTERELLMQAQKRQEDEARRQYQSQATQRLDSLVGSPVGGPVNGVRVPASSASPLPPERGSSYSVMHQHHNSAEKPTKPSDPTKRVQFSEATAASPSSAVAEPKTPQDPNVFIDEAHTFMNSSAHSKPTGNTPGVIGAQEVYRDPRQRRLNEQAQKAAASRGPGPEKLTFREKMKMFAMEADQAKN